MLWALAASVALILVVGAGLWVGMGRLAPSPIATAALEAFPSHPQAAGTAEGSKKRPRRDSHPHRHPRGRGRKQRIRAVWSPATTVPPSSASASSRAAGSFPIPDGVDLSEYDLVDISFEPIDGDPAHSGDSIVRGQLKSCDGQSGAAARARRRRHHGLESGALGRTVAQLLTTVVETVVGGTPYVTQWSVGSRRAVEPGTDAWLRRGSTASWRPRLGHRGPLTTCRRTDGSVTRAFDSLVVKSQTGSRDVSSRSSCRRSPSSTSSSGNRVLTEANRRLHELSPAMSAP